MAPSTVTSSILRRRASWPKPSSPPPKTSANWPRSFLHRSKHEKPDKKGAPSVQKITFCASNTLLFRRIGLFGKFMFDANGMVGGASLQRTQVRGKQRPPPSQTVAVIRLASTDRQTPFHDLGKPRTSSRNDLIIKVVLRMMDHRSVSIAHQNICPRTLL